jgi:hypothetical protein
MVIKGFDMSSAVHASTGHHQLVRAKCVKVGGSNYKLFINELLSASTNIKESCEN